MLFSECVFDGRSFFCNYLFVNSDQTYLDSVWKGTLLWRVTGDLSKNVKNCSTNYKTQQRIFIVVIIVNITEIQVYLNTWATLNLIDLIAPKYLIFSTRGFRSAVVFLNIQLCAVYLLICVQAYEIYTHIHMVYVWCIWSIFRLL